jgi:hypothetical protein
MPFIGSILDTRCCWKSNKEYSGSLKSIDAALQHTHRRERERRWSAAPGTTYLRSATMYVYRWCSALFVGVRDTNQTSGHGERKREIETPFASR